MENYELHIPSIQEDKKCNPINGRFLKGHIPYNKGKKLSEEHKRKISKTWFEKGHKPTTKYHSGGQKSKPIEMFTIDNKFIRNFSSINEAGKQTGIERRNISMVVNKERRTAGGFIWKEIK